MTPVGKAVAPITPTDVTRNMSGPCAPDAYLFGGALGMLDLTDRVKPMYLLGVGRLR